MVIVDNSRPLTDMKAAMRVKIYLIILFLQNVQNNNINLKDEKSCENSGCTTVEMESGVGVLNKMKLKTGIDLSTGKEYLAMIEKEEMEHKDMNEPKLKNMNHLQEEKLMIKLHNPIVVTMPQHNIHDIAPNIDHSAEFLFKEYNANKDQLVNETHYLKSDNDKTEKPKIETTTQLNTDITNELKNGSKTNLTIDTYHINHYLTENRSKICTCDLKVRECDINCCCDRDCNANMKTVFTNCIDSVDKASSQFCFNSRSIFKNSLQFNTNYDGLMCIVRNNLPPQMQFTEEMIIDNVTKLNKIISRTKVFAYSPAQIDKPQMQIIPYRFGDYVWSFSNNKTLPFRLPEQTVNMQCNSKRNIHYLTDYEVECLHSVPCSKEKCVAATDLGMENYLGDIHLIRSPPLVTSINSSDQVCSNKTCVSIVPYICREGKDLSSCVKSTPKHLHWDKICKNIVLSVEYHIYHNGTDGIKEARAYFMLRTLQKKSFVQKINLKFFWLNRQSQTFKRSGNPGYIIGQPIMSGRKVYRNNETMSLKKEAIELSYNPSDWLTVVGSKDGTCSTPRRSVGFGENAHYNCFVDLEEYDYVKNQCIDLQDGLFNLLVGNDFSDVKLNNNMNKFVATYGNSGVEDTGNWVQVIFDILPMIYSPVTFTLHSDFVICKNVISDLFIDVAYSKVGAFDRPQNKILGVHMYFGSPSEFILCIIPNCSAYGSGQKLKLSTFVNFIDLTREVHTEFAETPGFEAKLPHDFFYPFFSKSSTSSGQVSVIIFCVYFSFFGN